MTAGVSATCGSSDGAGSATGPSHSALVLGLVCLSLQTYAACLLPACSLGRQARPGVPAVKPTLAALLATIMFILFLSALVAFSRRDTVAPLPAAVAGTDTAGLTGRLSTRVSGRDFRM